MKTLNHFLSCLALLLSIFMLPQCSKKEEVPSAEFTSDKSEYIEGETATFTQQSANAETFRWTLPDGTTQKGQTASYAIPIHGTDGVIQIKLEVFSKSGAKSDAAVKNFPVKAASGDIMLWSYNNAYPLDFPFSVTVTIDNVEVFKGNMLNKPEPSCGQQSGCVFVPIKIGTHLIVVAPTQQTFTVQVIKDSCIKVKV